MLIYHYYSDQSPECLFVLCGLWACQPTYQTDPSWMEVVVLPLFAQNGQSSEPFVRGWPPKSPNVSPFLKMVPENCQLSTELIRSFRWASKSIWVAVLVVGWFIRLTENRIDPKCSMSSPNEFVYIRFSFLLKFFLSIVSSAYNYFQAQMRPFVTPLKYTLQWFRSFSLSCSIHLSWDNWLRYSLLLTSLYGNNKIHLMKNFQVSKGDSVFVLLFQTYRFWMSKIEIDIETIQY